MLHKDWHRVRTQETRGAQANKEGDSTQSQKTPDDSTGSGKMELGDSEGGRNRQGWQEGIPRGWRTSGDIQK